MEVDTLSPSNEKDIIKSIISTKMVYGDRFYVLNAKWWSLWKEYVRYDHESLSKNAFSGGRPDSINNEDLLENFDDDPEDSPPQEASQNSESDAQLESNQTTLENPTKITSKKSNRSTDVVLKKGLSEGHNYVLLPESAWMNLQSWYGGGPEICRSVIRCGLCGLSLQVDVFPLTLFINAPSNGIEKDVQVSRQATFKDIRRNLAVLLNLAPHKMILRTFEDDKEIEISSPENLNKTPEELGMEDGQVVMVGSKSEPSRHISMWADAPSFRRETDTEGTPPTKGVVGLKNLGNTCFMNSVLQCLSNTHPLVDYFMAGAFLAELNTQNAGGSKGNLANQFAALIEKLWSGKYLSLVPRDFKSAMANFAPQFNGYQQHDSQELLAFLLDGLHEDLLLASSLEKRNSKSKDSEPEPKLSADDAWLQYLSKNESFIVDLFQGQLKSTLVCDLCHQPNVTYDPFMFLSVPVPASKTRMIEVVFLPLINRPIRLGVRVPHLGEARDLKAIVAQLASNALSETIPPQQIILADIYNSRAFPIEDWKYLMDIRKADVVFAYQVLPSEAVVEEVKVEDVKHPFPEDYMDLDNRSNNNNVESIGEDGKTNDNNKQKLPVIRNIQLYQRRIISTHNNMHRTELFGFPYMLSFDSRITTNADLYSIIKHKLDTFLSSTPHCSEIKVQPMINIVNTSGKLCGLCKSSEQCAGCQLPCDESTCTLNPFSVALSLDWAVQDAAILFTDQNTKNFILPDKSLELTSDEKELLDVKLDDCIELFTKEEKLSSENKWFCPNCRTPNQATKKLDICKLPEVLIIHLKRFQYSGMYRDKLHQLVQFPIQLDFAQFLNKDTKDDDSQYQLFAVSNHMGGIESGHYIAYAKNNETDKWYKFDDSYCTEIQEDAIVTNNAYILFYHKVATKQTEARWKSRVDMNVVANLKTASTAPNDTPSPPKENPSNNPSSAPASNPRPPSPPAKRTAEDMETSNVDNGIDPSAILDVMHIGDQSEARNMQKCPYCSALIPCQEPSDMEMHLLTDCSAYSAFLK